jgi:hypothetical protein
VVARAGAAATTLITHIYSVRRLLPCILLHRGKEQWFSTLQNMVFKSIKCNLLSAVSRFYKICKCLTESAMFNTLMERSLPLVQIVLNIIEFSPFTYYRPLNLFITDGV